MRVSDLSAKAVITTQGEDVGFVQDVLLRPQEQRLGALVVKSPRFVGRRILPMEDISNIVDDAVTIQSMERLQDEAPRFSESEGWMSFGAALGRKVSTTSGIDAGELLDMHVDPATGQIIGYEVTAGRFAKMFGLSHTVEAGENTHLGRDVLIVADEAVPAAPEDRVQTPAQT